MITKPPLISFPILGHPLSRGLAGCWLFNEGGGNQAADLSGNGNTGSLVADTHFVPGKFGPALDFNGTTDYMTGPGNILKSNVYTVSLWVKLHELNRFQSIFSIRTSDADEIMIFVFNSSNMVVLGSWQDTGWYHLVPAVADEWIHFVLISDGTYTTVYKNAILAGSGKLTSFSTLTPSLIIGQRDSSYYYDGKIDSLTIYNRALTASEVQQSFLTPFCMFRRDPIELWSAASGGAPPSQTVLDYERKTRGCARGVVRGAA